jgi:hypothetical protein
MKNNKIISISLFNGFTLLLFASFLASCQKNSIKHFGHFSSVEKNISRSIASTGIESEQQKSFSKYFDLKQVYIYCKVNSVHERNCYQNNLNKIISNYESKNGKLNTQEKEILDNKFISVQTKVTIITKKIINKVNPHIQKLVLKRELFCDENSTYYLERCLNQYVESDTMKVLNKYQKHNKNINGHEYLYLKKQIVKEFKQKLVNSLSSLKSKEKRS